MTKRITPELTRAEATLILDSLMSRSLLIARKADEDGATEMPSTLRDLTNLFYKIQSTANDQGWDI